MGSTLTVDIFLSVDGWGRFGRPTVPFHCAPSEASRWLGSSPVPPWWIGCG